MLTRKLERHSRDLVGSHIRSSRTHALDAFFSCCQCILSLYFLLRDVACTLAHSCWRARPSVHTSIRAGPGSFFGEVALLVKDAKRLASVRAVVNCDLFSLSRSDFNKVRGAAPAAGRQCISRLAGRGSAPPMRWPRRWRLTLTSFSCATKCTHARAPAAVSCSPHCHRDHRSCTNRPKSRRPSSESLPSGSEPQRSPVD